MDIQNQISVAGTVTHIFVHRVVLETDTGKVLADLGPASVDLIALSNGMHVSLTGEMKTSELRANTVSIGDGPVLLLRAHKGDQVRGERADPDAALSSAEAQGFVAIGQPRRKPKHFEILAKNGDGELRELHVEFDGSLRKTKPVDRSGPKWADELERYQA